MKLRNLVLLTVLVLLIDQFSKIYIKTHFYYGEEVNVIGSWFKLHFIENEGMAFGMEFGGGFGKLFLTSFRLIAVFAGYFILKKLVQQKYSRGLLVCSALIWAGAIGNLIDSMFYGLIFTDSTFHLAQMVSPGQGYGKFMHGRVVDMLYFPMVESTYPNWFPGIGGRPFTFFAPIFNVADFAISAGVIALLIFQNRYMKKDEPAPETQP